MSSNTINFTINFDSDAGSVFNEINQSIGTVTGSTGKLRSTFNKLGESFFVFNQMAQGLSQVQDQLNAVIQPGAEFQQQIADLQAITGIAGDELDNLSDAAREVGKASGLGASQAAEAFKLLASNIDISVIGGVEGLKLLQKETITLAQAAGVDLPTAANTMAASINQFKLPATEAARVINVLAAGAKFGAAEIPDLSESLKYVGPVAGAAGVSIEETVAALEVLSQSAIKGSQAGTDMSNMLVRMQTVLGIDIGETGLSTAIQALKPHMKDVTFLTKVFGRESLKSVQTLIASADQLGVMTDRVTETEIAYEQAAIRTDTFSQKMARLSAWFENVKISVFNATEGMMPFLSVGSDLIVTTANLGGALQAFSVLAKTQFLTSIGAAIKSVWAFNVALWSNPIMIVIAAVAALVGSVIYAWKNFESFRGFLYGLWDSVKAIFTSIGELASGVFGGLGEMLMGIFTLDFAKIRSGSSRMGSAFKSFGEGVANAWTSGFDKGVADFRAEKKADEEAEKPSAFQSHTGTDNPFVMPKPDDNETQVPWAPGYEPGEEKAAETETPELNFSLDDNTGRKTGSKTQKQVNDVVSGGGRQVKNITFNIGSLVGENTNNFNPGDDPADADDFMRKLTDALQLVMNDVNYAN